MHTVDQVFFGSVQFSEFSQFGFGIVKFSEFAGVNYDQFKY